MLVPVDEIRDDARDKRTTAMEEDDISENEDDDDSNFWDDSSNTSTEDDVIRATVCNDGDSEEGDGDSDGDNENNDNDFAPESIFTQKKWPCCHKLKQSSLHGLRRKFYSHASEEQAEYNLEKWCQIEYEIEFVRRKYHPEMNAQYHRCQRLKYAY
eukprot:gene8533-9446_t